MSSIQNRPQVVLVTRTIVLNEKNEILLIQRSKSDSWNSGKWELPGGKLDEGQDISNALEREVFEETGLLVLPTNRLAYYESRILTSGKYKGLPYIVLIGIAKAQNSNIKISTEHNQYKWIGINEFENFDLTEESLKALITLGKQLGK